MKETETIVKAEKSKVNKRYAAIYNLLAKDFDKYIGNYSDTDLIGTYKYVHSKNVCNEKKLNEVEEGTAAYDDILSKIKNEDLFDDIPCVVDYVNRKEEKKRNIEQRRRNLVCIVSDNDDWGEPISMKHDFTIEEILDMPVMGEVVTNNSEAPKQDPITSKMHNMNIDESHGRKFDRELFCITGKDSDCIDIEDLY